MNFINTAQLTRDATVFASTLPDGTIGVLGVPRSGLLPAWAIAMSRHINFGDVYSFAETGKFTVAGRRFHNGPCPYGGTIVVVDDSVYMGHAMDKARAALERSHWWPHHKFTFAALYPTEESLQCVDSHHAVVNVPRRFEWNFMQRDDLKSAMCDIDGVLCRDPEVGLEDRSARLYSTWAISALPLYRPRFKINTLVTMRLERYRTQTEKWICDHNIEFGNLIMCPADSAEERRRTFDYGKWKGQQLKESDCTWGIESSAKQAPDMASSSGKPVICIETWEVENP